MLIAFFGGVGCGAVGALWWAACQIDRLVDERESALRDARQWRKLVELRWGGQRRREQSRVS